MENNNAPADAQAGQDINLTDDESINLFIEGIMEEKGLDDQSEEMREDIFADLKTRLLEEIDRSLVASLPDEKLDELSKVVAKDGQIAPEKVADAVTEAGIDVEEVTAGTMAKFRELYLNEEASGDSEKESTEIAEKAEGAGETEGEEEDVKNSEAENVKEDGAE